MRSFRFLCLLAVLFAPLWQGCRDLHPEAPKPTRLDSTLAVPVSTINIPLHYDLRHFETWLNEKIAGEFFAQGMKVREGKDSLFLKLVRNGRIEIRIQGDQLFIEFPLHAEGVYHRQIVGNLRMHNKHPLKTSLRLVLAADVSLGADWRLHTRIKLGKIRWIKDPVMRFGPLRINLREKIDQLIADKQAILEKVLEERIHDHVKLDKAVQKLWINLQKPMLLHKGEPALWMKSRFSGVSGAVHLNAPGSIDCDILVEARTAIAPDSACLPVTDSVLPPLKPYKEQHSEYFRLSIHAAIPFHVLDMQLNRHLAGQKVEKDGYKVVIKDVSMYGTDQGLAVRVRTGGDIRGDLYLVGRPTFHVDESRIRLDSFNYDIHTESVLLNTAHQMSRTWLLEYVSPFLEVEIGDYLTRIPSLIFDAVEKGKAGEAIDLCVDTLAVYNYDALVTRNDIQLVLYTKGRANIALQRLKTGKKLRIGSPKKLF